MPWAATAASQPWWIWIGGVCGLIFLTMNIVLMPRIGASATVVLPLVGQVFGGLVVDMTGAFDTAVRPLSLLRALRCRARRRRCSDGEPRRAPGRRHLAGGCPSSAPLAVGGRRARRDARRDPDRRQRPPRSGDGFGTGGGPGVVPRRDGRPDRRQPRDRRPRVQRTGPIPVVDVQRWPAGRCVRAGQRLQRSRARHVACCQHRPARPGGGRAPPRPPRLAGRPPASDHRSGACWAQRSCSPASPWSASPPDAPDAADPPSATNDTSCELGADYGGQLTACEVEKRGRGATPRRPGPWRCARAGTRAAGAGPRAPCRRTGRSTPR